MDQNINCNCLRKLLGIQSDYATKEEILQHYSYIAKLLLEIPGQLEILKQVSDAQFGLLVITENPGAQVPHNCAETRALTKQIANIVNHWKINNTDNNQMENLEKQLDEDFEALQRQHQFEAVGNHYAMWEPIFNHEAIKENYLLENEKNNGIIEGWGIEDDPDTIAMEQEDDGPSHGNRNIEKIDYHRYRPGNAANPQIILTFRCYWTGEERATIESLESVLQAPRAIRGYIRNISKRARNQLLSRYPALEMYRPISDKKTK